LPIINGGAAGQNVGRPLAASKAQCADVLQRRRAGESLRSIAEQTNLGLATVRTIIAKRSGMDRTTKKHRQRAERIEIDRQQKAAWNRQHRAGNHLPKRVTRYVKETAALIKEAKGL
jgi:aspartate oxidase